MRILKIISIIFLSLIHTQLKSDILYDRIEITKNLRCLVCQGQSVYDSDSDFADSMKILVDKKLEEGLSENEIYDFLRERYGNWIVYDPILSSQTIFLWFIPLILLVISGFFIFKKVNILRK